MFWARPRLMLARATGQSGQRKGAGGGGGEGKGRLHFQVKVNKIIILQIFPDLLQGNAL